MNRIFLYSAIVLLSLTSCKKCKKDKEMITLTGTIYKDCDSLSRNTTYKTSYLYGTTGSINEISTDQHGNFSFQVDKYSNEAFKLFIPNTVNDFCHLSRNGHTEDASLGVFREVYRSSAAVKIKTTLGLAAGDTLDYIFQYSNTVNKVAGPVTRDSVIAIITYSLDGFWQNPDQSDNRTFWWALNKPAVGVQDHQVDFKVHGCAVADTAYIVLP